MDVAKAIIRACEEAEAFDEAYKIASQQSELCCWLEELKAYKATGLTPEGVVALQASNQELKKEALPLMSAKVQDRLGILPCKVTDTVYITETVFENGKQARRNKPSGERVVSAQIDHVTIGGTTGKPVFDLCTETGGWYYSMEPEQFYLTREEAEAALREQEG
mgnify:FL=1